MWFWTITFKTRELKPDLTKNPDTGTTTINFPEIKKINNNIRALLTRLKRYGYNITKYIYVPEIKDTQDNKMNYHVHMILEATTDPKKIDKIKNKKHQRLVYDEKNKTNRQDGYINNPVLSEIWKEITQDGSYRIKPEVLKSRQGGFNYLLKYLNKPMQHTNIDNIPIMYLALKGTKKFRIAGNTTPLPEYTYELLDLEGERITFDMKHPKYVEQEQIPILYQIYKLNLYKTTKKITLIDKKRIISLDKKLIYTQMCVDKFQNNAEIKIDANQKVLETTNSDTEKILAIVEKYSCVEYNLNEIERELTQAQIDKFLVDKLIFKGYLYEPRFGHIEVLK